MRQDRFLLGILIGIAVLAVAAVLVFFTRQEQVAYRPGQEPDDVVHNYVLAVMDKDYDRAYGYLADLIDKPTFEEFRQAFAVGRVMPGQNGIRIGEPEISGDSASVAVTTIYQQSDPFSSGYSELGSAQLLRQQGSWRISSMPAYDVWDFAWYQGQPK